VCGRFTVAVSAQILLDEFGVEPPEDLQPRYNVAPQQHVPVIGRNAEGEDRFALLRWGLVPGWAKSPRDAKSTINARAETLLDRPSFREPFLHRRCLVVADGFYEWSRTGGTKQPWLFRLANGRPFAFAGLWDSWQDEKGDRLFSCAIVTTRANGVVAPVHDRMPVILDRDARTSWLDPATDTGTLRRMLAPIDDALLTGFTVSTTVNSVANDSTGCIEPLAGS
jgi:putative SOS response-associated peptidase YedK